MGKDSMTDTEDDLMLAIQQSTDEGTREILMFQLKLLRGLESSIKSISSRLDAFMSDEKKIAAIALNGHYETHSSDHSWLGELIKEHAQFNSERKWVQRKMAEEMASMKRAQDDLDEARKAARSAMFRIVERVVTWAAIAFLAWWGFL